MKKFRKNVSEIIVHCTATPAGRDLSAGDIDRYHRGRGFECIGYHYVVRLDGTVESGRPRDCIGAHCLGHNDRSIGVAYIGGTDEAGRACDTRTAAQRESLRLLMAWLKKSYPGATVHGHREFATKECPCFDVSTEL